MRSVNVFMIQAISIIILFLASNISFAQLAGFDSVINIYDHPINPWEENLTMDIKFKGTIQPNYRRIVLDEIENAITKYPSSLIKNSLNKINIVSTVFVRGALSSGVAYKRNLYLSAHYSNLEKAFHSLFATILLAKFPFYSDSSRWLTISSGQASKQETRNVGALLNRKNISFMNDNGYLSAESSTNWRIDFSTYAENLFAGGKQFWSIADANPKVKQKAMLIIKFYHQVYSIYTENWFRFMAEYRLF